MNEGPRDQWRTGKKYQIYLIRTNSYF
jgi:hypothetical protein